MKRLPEQEIKNDVPPLRIYREEENSGHEDGGFRPDDRPPFGDGEAFWAGRNLAMRRSARVAA
jgi:hypothetical protein